MNKLSGVVVAAGRSRRFNNNSDHLLSKQLISWDGRPLFIHTLQALSVLPIDEVALVIREEDHDAIESHRHLVPAALKDKLKICFGGRRRQDSVFNGLWALAPTDRVFVHDSARPFLSEGFLKRLEAASKDYTALVPVIPVIETLKEIDHSGKVLRTVDRNFLVRVQTPQFFKFSVLCEVHEHWKNSDREFTDDASMCEALQIPVQTCEGLAENIKVTTRDDLRQVVVYA